MFFKKKKVRVAIIGVNLLCCVSVWPAVYEATGEGVGQRVIEDELVLILKRNGL